MSSGDQDLWREPRRPASALEAVETPFGWPGVPQYDATPRQCRHLMRDRHAFTAAFPDCFPSRARPRRMASALAPNGVLLVVGHDPRPVKTDAGERTVGTTLRFPARNEVTRTRAPVCQGLRWR